MDHVHRNSMYKTLDKVRGENVPTTALILMATFVYSCIKLRIDPRKWSARSVLETLWEKERVDPVTWFPEQIVKVIWQNASSPELSNKHQGITWLVVRRALPSPKVSMQVQQAVLAFIARAFKYRNRNVLVQLYRAL
eukprot:g33034.t1